MSGLAIAKVFMNGRSQAVRLPKEFRFDTDQVTVEKVGDAVLLRPLQESNDAWIQRLTAILAQFEGLDAVDRDRRLPVDDIERFDQ